MQSDATVFQKVNIMPTQYCVLHIYTRCYYTETCSETATAHFFVLESFARTMNSEPQSMGSAVVMGTIWEQAPFV